MKIFKRGSVWWGVWSANGVRYRKSGGTSDLELAREYLAKQYAESFRQSRMGEVRRKTWVEATVRYLEEHSHLRTIDEYAKHSAWWTRQFDEHRIAYLDEVHPDIVSKIRDTEFRRPKKRGGGERTAASVNRKIAYLRAVMNAAYREYRWFGKGEEPPLFRFIPGEVERERFLTPSEVLRLIEALPEPYGIMAKMAVATGLRRTNILSLRWDQVNLGERTLIFSGELMKNGKPFRIPLSGMAVDILRSQFGKSGEWVFPLADGRSATQIPSKMWASATKKAALDNLRWHDLRHTWASLMRQQGLPLEVIRELGGWRDSKMVQRYSHLSTDHLHRAAGQIDRAFDVASESSGTFLAQWSGGPSEKIIATR
jgi:integrase